MIVKKSQWYGDQARMQGVHPKKVTWKKRKTVNKIKKIDQNYHNAVYKWVKSGEILRG